MVPLSPSHRFPSAKMLARLSVALLLVCAALQHTTASTTPPPHHPESYSESLTLSPFPDGKVLSTFNFSLSGTWDPEGVTLASNTVCASSPLSTS